MRFSLNRSVVILLGGTLCSRIAFFMYMPYLAIYLGQVIGLAPKQIGLIIGINPLITVICAFFSGEIIDCFSLKKILVVFPFLWSFVFLFISTSNSFYTFLILNGLNGLCYIFYEPACKKALSQSAESNSVYIFNLRYAAINIGAVLGPLLTSFFRLEKSVVPFLLLAAIYGVQSLSNSFLQVANFEKAPLKKQTATLKHNFNWPLIFLLAGVTCSYFGYSQLNATISQFLISQRNSGELYSLILSASAALIVLGQFPVLTQLRRFSAGQLLLVSNLLLATSQIIAIGLPHIVNIILFTVTYSLGELFLGARFDLAIHQLADSRNQGYYFSISEVVKLGATLGPIVSGTLISWLGWQQAPLIFVILAGITGCGSLFLRQLLR